MPGRKIAARLITAAALLAAPVMWASEAHAQVVFNEPFGPTGQLPTTVSTADGNWALASCLNGRIILDTNFNPTHMLHHNSDNCAYTPGQAVWRNVVPIPAVPGRSYVFSYRSTRLNTVSDPILSQSIETNAGGSVAIGSISNGAWPAPGVWLSRSVAFTAGAGTTSLTLRVNNANTTGGGNDFLMDDMVLLDVTPQLSKAFSPASLGVGGSSTLTFTITNAAELGAKNGWSFTDTLPAGLTVASADIATNCPSGVLTAPIGASAISLSGNLTAGLASCTATIPVTANTAGAYTNGASNITSSVGLNPPTTSTSVTFNTQPNFACNANMYLAQSSGGPTTLFQFDSSNNPFIYNALGTSAPNYNAIGFNPADGYIYGATQVAGITHLLRIGSNGLATDLGAITGGGINATTGGFQNGEIGTDGVYYLYNQIKGLYRVNLTTRVAVAVPLSRPPETSDLAWYNGLLYGVETNGQLVSIHPSTGAVTNIGTAQTPRTFGAMISASNGIFAADNAGGFFRINPTTGATTLISSSPSSVGNDGAKCATTPLTFAGDLSITKTDNVPAYSPGTDTTYTIVVSNSGPFGVQGATVEDPLPAGITTANWTCVGAGGGICGAPSGTGGISSTVSLPVGGTATYTLTMSVPVGFTGDLVNTASVTSPPDSPDSNPGGNTATDTNVPQAPAMTIVKTGTLNDLDGDGLLDLGETINYTFRVTNTGNVPLSGVTVSDPLVTVNQGPQTLAPGGAFTFTASYTPSQADIDNGSVVNTASGTGTDPSGGTITSPPDTVVVPPDQTPGLTIVKTGTLNDLDGDALIDLGETISYSFLVTNTGTLTMSNVMVNDPLVTIDQGPQTLAPGASFTFTATYTPTQADIDTGAVTNTASATGTEPGGGTTESPPDTVTVPPDQTPGLTIVKTGTLNDLDGDGLLDLGETISYAFLVRNTGTVTQTNVSVDDPLVTIDQGPQTLAPGGSFTFTATYTPTQADIDNGSVVNTASGTGTDPGGSTTTSPPDTVTVPPDQTPGLTVVKTGTLNDLDGDNLLDAGETISYAFLVRNTGTVTLTNVMVEDPLVTIDQGPQTLAPGAIFTFTARYTPTQADVDNGSVVNTATATGTPPSGPPITSPPDTVTIPPSPVSLGTVKTGVFNDLDGDGNASLGDTITYTILITNEGGQTANGVWPLDAGPTFNGRPAANSLSTFEPGPVTLAPGQSQAFTATYVLDQTDIDNAAGLADGVANTARAQGSFNGINVPSSTARSEVTIPAAASGDISVAKIALRRQIRRGEEAPFAITVTNHAGSSATGLTIVDTLPSGFRYVEGSATIGGVAATPVIDGRRVVFEGINVPANAAVEIRLRMLALSSAGPGEHVNRASVTDAAGNPLAPDATATVEIMIEPVFDCSEIIGRVFDDKNRNGYQDEGELGLPGVRLATVKGWLVTTDAHGRFHVACAALPDQRIGSNFIMKLDPRTLPSGYRLTTENPRVVRLTAGKMTSLDFGVAIGRVVRLDLQDQAFEPGSTELLPQWAAGVDQLIEVLDEEQSVLRLSYIDPGADPELAEERLRQVSDLIRDRWERLSGQYRLEIEMRVETGL
ncbi:hypothetical protein N8A98_03515 [Devosia neptuniae]|uniref:DUF11 domain-containing protein n=1 Tax=Devosia neptuniae TaxID=191302 RepID=A0ABY6CDH1_9HYPH|nr:hypothetical protein [Devosia neptuniae]UXN70279.1 hypothetical protein N8A98_03515 [Devosia neptuniae]